MNTFTLALVVLYAVVLLVWLVRRWVVARVGRHAAQLGPGDAPAQLESEPLISVLIPAKDEEYTIGPCLDSILGQSYKHLEVFVIDDRSKDRTAEVVRSYCRRDDRVRLLQTGALPPGWTGKTYALAQGTAEATGEWLLFLDADTSHAPENLAAILHYAQRNSADLVTLLPALDSRSFWEQVVQPLAAVLLMKLYRLLGARPWSLRLGRSGGPAERAVQAEGFANGQYILIQHQVYQAVGGHSEVRDRFLEDVELGRLVHARGYKVEMVLAPELTKARMYTNAAEVVGGWSRILYGAVHDHPAKLVSTGLSMWAFSCSAFAMLVFLFARRLAAGTAGWTIWEPWWTVIAGMNAAHLILMGCTMAALYDRVGSRRRWLAFYPLACLAMTWILMRALAMCFTHRVHWRGRQYHRAVGAPHIHRSKTLLIQRRQGAAVSDD